MPHKYAGGCSRHQTYSDHAFYDPATGVPKPNDGRPVYDGLRPGFVWPQGA